MKPRVTLYSAEWCAPCRIVKPLLEKLKAEYAGKVTFRVVDTDTDLAAAQKANVQALPVLLFEANAKTVQRIDGRAPRMAELKKIIDHLLTPSA